MDEMEERMEESWRGVVPGNNPSTQQQPGGVLNTGREAYLRTKQMLDEASAVSSMLFLDEADMSHRYRKAYEREDALHATAAVAAAAAAATGSAGIGTGIGSRASPSALFGESSLFLPSAGAAGGGGGGRGWGVSGGKIEGSVLAAGRSAPLGASAVDIRPEEKKFCDAFLELQSLLKRLPPGARAQPDQIIPILNTMHDVSADAESAASDAAARLRELRGTRSPAAAGVAATAHELSLEKDTWALLVFMNLADKEDRIMEEDMRRDQEEAISSSGTGAEGGRLYAPPGPNASDQDAFYRMRCRDSEFRRTEAVVEWLQRAAFDRLEASGQGGGGRGSSSSSGGGGGGHLGWSNTLASLAAGSGQKGEVGQMDPDASLRKVSRGGGGLGEGLKVLRLVGQDDLDEEELLRTAWVLVRAGRMSQAMRLCERSGQPWRAAAMAGGGVVGTGKIIVEDEEEEEEDIAGGYGGALYSPGQGLWQEMCWQLSDSLERGADSSQGPAMSVAKHEAALFAHFAGNAGLLLDSDLTQSWEDQAWVRFTALLHLKVLDERIRHRRSQAELSALYPGVGTLATDERLLSQMTRQAPPTSHGAIFEVLDDNSRGRVQSEGKGVYRQAQQALVLGDKNIPLFLRTILWRVATATATTASGDDDDYEDERGRGRHVDGNRGGAGGGSPEEKMVRSPQLLRFAAHLALLLAAQCPYLTTMEEETVEAIEDVVFAYTEHLAKTQQVGLVAIYAATLPTRRRRDLYAGFLRSLEGGRDRQEALEQAKAQMPGDVPAILKKVVEDVRLQTVSVAPPMPKQVPEGDMKKIKAMSWLLDHPDTQSEASVQANTLARHLVLQKYQRSVMAGGRGGFPWGLAAEPPAGGDDGDNDDDNANFDEMETPVVLSARLEAVKILLDSTAVVPSSSSSSPPKGSVDGVGAAVGERAVIVGDDDERERECWLVLLEAREAYVRWVAVRRAGEDGGGGGGGTREEEEEEEAAVRNAAEKAMEALEGVLTFEDGWMYPVDPATATYGGAAPAAQGPASASSSLGSWEHVDAADSSSSNNNNNNNPGGEGGGGMGATGMVVSFPMEEEEEAVAGGAWGEGDDLRVLEEKRKAKEVDAEKRRRAREEEASVKGMEEVVRRAAEAARKEELLSVREACLPGLVFMTHEVAHSTGIHMLRRGSTDAARTWFSRGQTLANTIVNEEHRTLLALSPGHIERFLKRVERSTTKLLECAELNA